MASGKTIYLALLAVAATEVTSWTIDLPYARKLFFSQNRDENAIQISNDTKYYNNVEPNSFHNADDYYYNKYVNENKDDDFDNRGYAEAYKHEGYMEKKVHDIVRKGSIYLDGLKRSLERYAEVLKNCSRMGFNETRNSTNLSSRGRAPPSPFPSSNFTQTSDFQTSNYSPSDVPQFNFTSTNFSELNPGFSNRDSMEMCARATKRREHVRRLTDLALWATKRLEDNVYDAKYNKYYEQEENELLLKLAWFLDRLAHYTGYEPNVQEFVDQTTTAKPPTNLLPSIQLPFDNVPRDVVQRMMDCMKSNSSEPATERCRYPLPLPELVQRAYESRDPSFANSRPQDPTLRVISPPNSDSLPESSSLELLLTADTAAAKNFAPKSEMPGVNIKTVRKRSIDEESPLLKLMKYYGKHKVWVNSNPLDATEINSNRNFEVPNQLPVKSVQKRSLFKKHIHLRIPEKPFHALRDHMKKEAGIHYEKNKEQIKLIKGTLEKMRHTASLTVKHNLKKFDHVVKKIHKRSVGYGRKFLPRISENPYQDLSYYSKNAKGVEYNYDPAQAALVRLGLEQIFQTGNIEVVRRYGSNFNPLDPNPFFSGLIRASLDV
ncbi:uncharacterized protein LOC106138942 [Amyelois transitella]|uniref:uncharacterized protein LOC106138942 n=1 Tax=Amyelois transitella TaxID=680683 RepID=UPI00299003D7|nr:uncharacterized protein LOC106138942 [Amyelois transitella]